VPGLALGISASTALRGIGPSLAGRLGGGVSSTLFLTAMAERVREIRQRSLEAEKQLLAAIGVGMAVADHPSLRTGRADFPHPALQSVSHPLAAGLVRSARAKAYREISPRFSKNALG